MSAFLAAFRFQLQLTARSADALQVCLTAPAFTLIFLAMTENSGRGDLAPYGVIAPTLMSLWTVVLLFGGQIISDERRNGSLEGLVASPVSLSVLVSGRLLAAAIVGMAAFAEAWLVAGLVFGRWLTLWHPVAFVMALAVTGAVMAAHAAILSPLFILMPSARIIQNSLSYPFYLLGGVVVPVSLLPQWIRPFSRLVFLSWASDLLRDSLRPGPLDDAGLRLLALIALGVAAQVAGVVLLRRVLVLVRTTGTLSRSV